VSASSLRISELPPIERKAKHVPRPSSTDL
jgi:hypothetical protein